METKSTKKKQSKLKKEIKELTIPKFKDVLKDLRLTIITTIVLSCIIFGINTGMQEILRLIL